MSNRKAWIVAALFALSGGAFAQGGNGGGSAGGGGNGAGMSSSDQAGVGAASSGTHAAKKHKKSSHTKPATDTTNMPGADASSDTKGQ
ncbi:hypothetical protein [Paraburkholderia azotifigens]|uniref:Uncharacterized protein n=1 Tax=Paraburkholderia azotifigens TaxID=2057004 RepID=A0A5C6VGB5_9BURK|nr:hypothetical protein [Paraburkholderia azotifigens]TXC84227.1 hypothetical protein FRZ40_28455 [Paraburkholderia azotifigens]